MRFQRAAAAAAVLSAGLAEAAAVSPQCLDGSTGVCYGLNIPDATASSGKGDIYFQISAPTSMSWVALGQGSTMAGANIFVIYMSADGKNVTLSPRSTSGHVQPQFNSDAKATLLAGSGVANGYMTANVRCSNCDSWSGSSMDFTGGAAKWVYAYSYGDPLMTDDVSAGINQHKGNNADSFTWNFSNAKGGSDSNPFITQNAAVAAGNSTTTGNVTTTTTSGGVVCTPNSNSTQGGPPWAQGGPPRQRHRRDACPEGSSPVTNSNTTLISTDRPAFDAATFDRAATAHGILAGLAFVALFPTGGIMIRLANFPGLVRAHAALQIVAYAFYFAAFGIGAWMMRTLQPSEHGHPMLGGIIFLVLLSQPITGWLHHRKYAATGGASGRTKTTFAHLGIGRAAILLGMLNGGLGLHMAGVTGGPAIAYGVIALLMAIAYIASIIIGENRRKRRLRAFGGDGTVDRTQRVLQLHALDAEGNRQHPGEQHPSVGGASDTDLTRVETQVPKYN